MATPLTFAVVAQAAETTSRPAAWVSLLVLTAGIVGGATCLWALVRFGGPGGPDAGPDDDGGGGGSTPRPPSSSPPQGGLVSWPEFERQFADYVAATQRPEPAVGHRRR